MGRNKVVESGLVLILGLMLAMPAISYFGTQNAEADEVLCDIIGATRAQGLGFDGSGILIGEIGSGLDTGDNATVFTDFSGRVEHWVDWSESDDADGIAEDGLGMSTPFVSWMAGDSSSGQFDPVDGKLYGQGIAPGASIITERVFNDGGNWFNGDIIDVFADAGARGTYSVSNSWGGGTNYEYGFNSFDIDTATRDSNPTMPGDQPLLIVMAAGNTDIMESGCSKNGITASVSEGYKPHKSVQSDNIEQMWVATPTGPAADGRIKPDLVAPATRIPGTQSHAPGTVMFGDEVINADYLFTSGSGGAAAIITGASALFAQYYLDLQGALPSPAMTKAAFINGATDMDDAYGTTPIPNVQEGWGRLNLTNVVAPDMDVFYDDQAVNLLDASSQLYETLFVNNNGVPLKISVAYTDVPAPSNTGTARALINDLDLTVISPGGTKYVGNGFVNGWSDSSITAPDTINNVENIYIQTPELGQWLIYVNGTEVLQDAVSATPGIDQDYALVVTGSFDIGGGPVAIYGYADPNPTGDATTITIYASFADVQNIIDAEYFIDAMGNGTGDSLIPSDGTFDSPDEDAYATIDIGALGWLPGEVHIVYVHAYDSDLNWGSFYPITVYVGTQYYLHVENSIGTDMSLWKTAPDQPSIITNTSGPVSGPGDYQIGNAWITDAFIQDKDVEGTWRFFMNGYVTTDDLSGNLYAKVYEHSTMTLLNPTPTECSTDVANRFTYYEFNWEDNLASSIISAGDRIYLEIWLNAVTGGGGADVSVYDYVGDTAATPPDYGYLMDVNSCVLGTGPDYTLTPEFTDPQYVQASVSDDDWAVSADPGNQDEIFIWNSMAVYDDPAYMTQIDMTFEGQGDDNTDFEIWIQRRAGGDYWEPVGTAMAATAGVDITMTRSITVNLGDYVLDDRIRWGVYGTTSRLVVSADYLELQVHYDKPSPEFVLGYDNDSAPSRIIVPEIAAGPVPTWDLDCSGHVSGDWILISIPIDASGHPEDVLNDTRYGDGSTDWDKIYAWNGPNQTWMSYSKNRQNSHNTLTYLDNTMGIWLRLTATGDDLLTIGPGSYSAGSVFISLFTGWNLVSYPSATSMDADATLPGNADFISVYNGGLSYLIEDLVLVPSAVTMSEGEGYWVHVTSDIMWIVDP